MKKFILGAFLGSFLVVVFFLLRSTPQEEPIENQVVLKESMFDSHDDDYLESSKPQIPAPLSMGVKTPYDRYMIPTVGVVLGRLNAKPLATKEMTLRYLNEGYGFKYKFTDPYMPMMPQELYTKRSGDCKDKSLWLAERINDPNIQFVIGRCHPKSKAHHAWLLWQSDGVWWILDCTNKYYVMRADSIKEGYYVPVYSYLSDGAGSIIASEY